MAVISFFACMRLIHSGSRSLNRCRLSKQRAPGALPEAGAEITGPLQRTRAAGHRGFRALTMCSSASGSSILLELHDHGVVVGVDVGFAAVEALAPGRLQRQRPGPVHRAAPEGVDHQLPRRIRSPVAPGPGTAPVPGAGDGDAAAAPGGLALTPQVADQFHRGDGVEAGPVPRSAASAVQSSRFGRKRLLGAFEVSRRCGWRSGNRG